MRRSALLGETRARERDEALDRNVLGARGRLDAGRGEQRQRIGAERFQALAQHLAALAEGRLGDALAARARSQASGVGARHRARPPTTSPSAAARRRDGRDVEQDARLACASRASTDSRP